MNAPDLFRYRAFLSYSHRDAKTTAWLHAKLEGYRLPSRLVGKPGSEGTVPQRLIPIFRDRSELAASSSLSAELTAAIQGSRFLIVVCSTATPKSRWVNEEIRAFKMHHGEQRVLAIIVDGEPGASANPDTADRECFPPALRYKLDADGHATADLAEPIAADVRPHGDGKHLAVLKLVAALAGTRLDDLIQREAQRRIRRLTAVIAASVIGMLVTGGLAIYAEMQRRHAVAQTATAEAAVDFLVGMFNVVDSGIENPNTVTAVSLLKRGAERAETDLQAQPLIHARIADTIGRVYNNLGLYQESEATLGAVRPLLTGLGDDGVPGLLTLATSRLNRGDIKGAEAIIGGLQTRFAADPPSLLLQARTMRLRGDVLAVAAEQEKAVAAYARAVDLYGKAPGATPRMMADAATSQGVLLTDMTRYKEAGAALAKANALYRKAVGEKHRLTGISYNAIAYNDFSAGDLGAAKTHIDQALAIFGTVLDPDSPMVADALSLRGQIQQKAGDPAGARASLGNAVAIYDKSFGKPHYLTGIALVSLALVEADLGNTDAAMADFDKAKHNYDISYGGIHANHGDLLVNRATVEARAGNLAQARKDCAAGLKILTDTLGADAGYTLRMKQVCDKTLAAPARS